MNAFTILQYLCGSAAAIRRVASSPVTLPVGIVLVAMAGVARNYDQMVLDWNLKWFLGPLVHPWALWALVVLYVGITHLPLDLNGIEPFDAYVISVAGASALAIAVVGLVFSLFTPMAYCKYGCPTGALFKMLRSSGEADRFSGRDWAALIALILGACLVFLA